MPCCQRAISILTYCFLPIYAFSGAHPTGELGGLLREWQTSLGDYSTAASFGFALRLFHGIVRHLFLRQLEVLASTHYDLSCDRRWNKLQPSNLKVRRVVGVVGVFEVDGTWVIT